MTGIICLIILLAISGLIVRIGRKLGFSTGNLVLCTVIWTVGLFGFLFVFGGWQGLFDQSIRLEVIAVIVVIILIPFILKLLWKFVKWCIVGWFTPRKK